MDGLQMRALHRCSLHYIQGPQQGRMGRGVPTNTAEFWAVKLGKFDSMAAYLFAIEEKVARLSQYDKKRQYASKLLTPSPFIQS